MKRNVLGKKLLGIMLVLALTAGMVGCGNQTSKEPQDGKADSSGEDKKNGQTDDSIVDLGGYEFTIGSGFLQNDPDMDAITGAERAFEEARRQVEEAYNCKIKIVSFASDIESVRTKIMSGDKIADVLDYPVHNLLQSVRAGYVQSLDDIDGLYPDDSRWVEGYTNIAKYDGVSYGVNPMRPAEVRTCLVYNRDLLKECGVEEDIVQLVRDKQWTYDKFAEIAKKCTRDTDGDGKMNTYGLYTYDAGMLGVSLINANGGKLVEVKDGLAKESYNSENTLNALNALSKWINEDKFVANIYTDKADLGVTTTEYAKHFAKGECAFLFCESWLVNQNIKQNAGNLDYGMVPLPLGPDAEDYVSTAFNGRVFAIPSTNTENLDKTVIVLNALGKAMAGDEEDGEEWWEYDVEMDYFQKGDTDSVEMYKLLLDKSYVDLGSAVPSLLDDFKKKCVVNPCFKSIGTPAAQIEAIDGQYQSTIDGLFN